MASHNNLAAPAADPPVHLSRQQKADALRNVKELLAQVHTDWAYSPPVPRPPLPPPPPSSSSSSGHPRASSSASTVAISRSGVLGAWRPSADDPPLSPLPPLPPPPEPEAEDSWDDAWNSTDPSSSSSSSDSDDLDDADAGPRKASRRSANGGTVPHRALSYRRPPTPPPVSVAAAATAAAAAAAAPRRKRKRARINGSPGHPNANHVRAPGAWRQREDDSDFELPPPPPQSSPYRWDSPAEVPSQRRQRRRHDRELMRDNPGLRTWLRRRDQWTGADAEGWVPLGTSRFEDNPLARLVSPAVYTDIYQRCVVRGAELPVPINLSSMVAALVAGWQADDLWPPKPSEPGLSPAIAQRSPPQSQEQRDDGSKSMSGRVRRYLGIR